MRTHSLVFAAALTLGWVLTAPAVFAQDASDRGTVRRWPTAADGGASVSTGRAAVARNASSVEASRPAERATGAVDGRRVSSRDRIAVDQGQLEQRRSPGGGGGGGGTVRGGGGGGGRVAVPRGPVGGGGAPVGDGGGRVAVPRGTVGGGYPGGYPGGRHAVAVRPGGYYGYPYYPYYYPYYPYSSFYFGVGFSTWGYWPAYGYGGYGGYPYAYGGHPYAYPYAYPYGGGYGYAGNTGRVRLEVQPRDAEVFIDGYFAGLVDDFDGRMQGLELESGGYNVEIRKPGWETLTFDVRVTPGRTTRYKSELIPIRP